MIQSAGPRILSVSQKYRGWTEFSVARLLLPDGHEIEREILRHGRAAAVLPYDPGRRVVILVELLRAAALLAAGEETVLEAPAGMMDEDDPAETVRREAMEEAGLRLGALEPVADAWVSPGISTERTSLFLAPYAAADRVAAGGGAVGEHENITIHEMPVAELWRMVEAGRIVDMKTLALALALRARHAELFG
jgi:nudix-type nucleoside diphosphatase (YffH/AdpP family)